MTETNWEKLKLVSAQAKAQKEELEADLDIKQKTLDEKIAMLKASFGMSNAELIGNVETAREKFTTIETELRERAVEHFKETGEKQIGFGISVRVNTTYEYDEQKAVEYAIAHKMPHLLKVDGTKFKKFASITPIDFVKPVESPSAVVSYTKD